MPVRSIYLTRALELAKERGWSRQQLAERAGLSIHTIKSLAEKRRTCGAAAIEGFRRAFPDVPFHELFYVIPETDEAA